MAEEKAIVSPESRPTVATDSHKRKLEDLELKNATEPLIESEPTSDPHSVINGAQGDDNAGEDESEAKRQRLESNGDDVNEKDGVVSLNGQEDEKEDEPDQEVAEHPTCAGNEAESVEVQEAAKENLESSVEEPHQNEKEKDNEIEMEGKVNENEKEKDNEIEMEGEVNESEKENEEANEKEADAEKTEDENSGNQPGHHEPEGEEPSEELPKDGDVPVPSADKQPGSDDSTLVLSRKMDVPNDKVGVLIGKAGDTIRSLQDNSGAKIQIVRDSDADPRAVSRPLELVGTLESINKAEKLIKDVIAEADAGGSPSLVARGFNAAQAASGGEQIEIQVPFEKVGLIIGKGGETIRNMQTRSGARIQLIQQTPADGNQSRERTVRVTGNKKQIETAREMINDVMNQTVRPSPLSGGYDQQGYRPRRPAGPQWGPRGPPNHAQFSGYDYPQRGPYPSQNSQYPPPSYGNYPPPQGGPRSNFGPSWEQRPPSSFHGPSPQGNYNYGQQHGQDYGHPPYSQTPAQPPYGHGYNDVKYDSHSSSQYYGPMGSQPTPYGQGGAHSGYGQQDQYGKPPMYGVTPQAPHSQPPYNQPRPNQPPEVPYQGPGSSAQLYNRNMPPQQSYPYASTGMMPQTYPPYGSAPTTDGYSHNPAPVSASASGYGPQGGQPTAPGYGQTGTQQPPAYHQTGHTGNYGSYPTAQPGYTEQQPAADNTSYGYQGPADLSYAAATAHAPAASYPANASGQSGYTQPSQMQQPGAYDQSGGYGSVPAATGYGKSSPQPAAYPQYDTSQVYGAHR